MIDRDDSATDAILPRQAILASRNCPQDILDAGNLPWRYAGDVAPTHRETGLTVLCRDCAPPLAALLSFQAIKSVNVGSYIYIYLRGMRWITDDMLEVVVYWGRCHRCGAVYWAKKLSPLTRHMRHCPSPAE